MMVNPMVVVVVVFIGKMMAKVQAALVIGMNWCEGGEGGEGKVLWLVGAVIVRLVCGI